MDIARMLLSDPSDLAKYDVPVPVLDVLASSRVKHVSVIGRRGPFQAAFTTKEVRELMHLPLASMSPIAPALLEPPAGTTLTRQQSRVVDLLRKGSTQSFGSTPRSFSFDFYRSPTGLATLPPTEDGILRANLNLAHTELDASGNAIATSASSTLSTSLVVTALGHRAEPSASWYDPILGHIRNVSNRVVDETGHVLKNVYASGWAATGARGVLATTMRDAHTVADAIIADHAAASTSSAPGEPSDALAVTASRDVMDAPPVSLDPPREVLEAVKQGNVCTYDDWKKVDEEEIRRGKETDKERERMVSWDQAKAWLKGQ
jgi:adrenodoxin-NADP+ reductase